jgi:hypothetical protein
VKRMYEQSKAMMDGWMMKQSGSAYDWIDLINVSRRGEEQIDPAATAGRLGGRRTTSEVAGGVVERAACSRVRPFGAKCFVYAGSTYVRTTPTCTITSNFHLQSFLRLTCSSIDLTCFHLTPVHLIAHLLHACRATS